MRKNKRFMTLLILMAALVVAQNVSAQFTLPKGVLSSGGAVLEDRDYRIVGTVGQPVIGVSKNANKVSRVGFWYLRTLTGVTETEEADYRLPKEYALHQNYPNPFNPETRIEFQIPRAGGVVVRVFNILGQQVRMLADKEFEAGTYHLFWDGRDDAGRAVSTGVYLYQIQAGDPASGGFQQVRKMSLLR